MSTLFEFLPIGAYRTSASGKILRANAALVRMNGYDSEAALLAEVNEVGYQWYADPKRRQQFRDLLERDQLVIDFISEVHRNPVGDTIWVREAAHCVSNAQGELQYYEGTVEDITASLALTGLEPAAIGSVVAVVPIGDGAVRVIYTTPDGTLKDRLLSRADEESISVATSERPWSYAGDTRGSQQVILARGT